MRPFLGLAVITFAQLASAQDYPNKPIRFIVGFAPGGVTDIVARALSQKLHERLGQQVVVDNRAGGAGTIAAVIAAKAPPDGYTLLMSSISALATNVSVYANLQYDPLRDFAPVTLALATPYLATVQAGLPVNSLREFPTIAESGLAGYEATSWQGVVAPAGTPRAIVMKLNREILRALQLPDIGARLAAEGAEPGTTTPDEFAADIRREIVKWAKVVRESGVRID